MKKTKRPTPEPVPAKPYECLYHLKIHLLDINPQVYRRFIVRGDTTVVQLHHIVQVVMGWDNWHLHYFQIFGRQYGIDYTGGNQFLGIPQITRLGDFGLRTNDTFHYLYDYYDRWAHQLRIEAITSDDGRYRHPRCLEGKRACPPEDTGGPNVYTHRIDEQRYWAYDWLDTLVERLQAGENPMEDNVPAWYFTHQPERFDLKAINQKLAKLYQIKGCSAFWEAQGCYDELEDDFEEP